MQEETILNYSYDNNIAYLKKNYYMSQCNVNSGHVISEEKKNQNENTR